MADSNISNVRISPPAGDDSSTDAPVTPPHTHPANTGYMIHALCSVVDTGYMLHVDMAHKGNMLKLDTVDTQEYPR